MPDFLNVQKICHKMKMLFMLLNTFYLNTNPGLLDPNGYHLIMKCVEPRMNLIELNILDLYVAREDSIISVI